MFDITYIAEYFNLLIAIVCCGIGVIVKNCTPIDNKYIIPINIVFGIFLASWVHSFALTPVILVEGVISGWGATGLYETIRDVVENLGEG